MDTYPPAVQRSALLKFAEALKSRDSALRRDECGDWRINGKNGHIYAVPGSLARRATPGFQIFVMNWSARGWNSARKALEPFTDVTNDGDDEGTVFLDHIPTEVEAALIRHWVRIAKKMEFSPEDLARRREWASTAREKKAQKPASDEAAGGY